jgi:hypothetical protein
VARSRGATPLSPVRGLVSGTRSSIGNPWVTVDPVVGGSLEDDFCDLIS